MSEKISVKQIRFLQTLRKLHGIDDELYAEIKRSVGVDSTTELTQKQFSAMKSRIEGASTEPKKRSWKPVHKSARRSGMHTRPPMEKERSLAKIEAILADLGLPWSYADSIVQQMFAESGTIKPLRMCDASETYKVMQALIYHQKRREGADAADQA